MKKILFIAAIPLLFTACDHTKTEETNTTADSLTIVINERNASLTNFISSIDEIESNLDSVAAKQQIISLYVYKPGNESKGSKKEHINSEIQAINNLMTKNREKMESLSKRLNNSTGDNKMLQKMIKTLNIQISQKDYDLCELNIKLTALNQKVITLITTVDSLSQENYIKSIIIDYQASDLHNAYYIVGETKELKEAKVIDQKGGLLGIGRTSTLSEDFDATKFTRIDFTKTNIIPINSDDIKIITNHPTYSYTLEMKEEGSKMVKNLVITNPEKFWSASKYLVIVKN